MSSPNGRNEFPDFEDADVSIMSQTGKMWKLHHQTLANNSEVFKEIFARNTTTKKSGIRWRIHMIDHPMADDADRDGAYYKEFKFVPSNGKSNAGFSSWNAMGGEEPEFNTLYDNLFRCMYNIKPDFGSKQDSVAWMKRSLCLLTAASYAKAYPAVRLFIENCLLQFNQFLWLQVETYPETWASIACRLQSGAILREAMIHLAGRYHLQTPSIRKTLLEKLEWGRDIFELAADKARELKDYKLKLERCLLEFVPPRMQHPPIDTVDGLVTAGRQVYAGDIYWWMCLHLIRQYFSTACLQNCHHRAEDGGISFYRTIAAPHAYLLKEALDTFHEQFCMTPKSRVVFVHAMNELKKEFVPIVEGILIDHCQAQRGLEAPPRSYLTCTVVLDEEMTWKNKSKLRQPQRRRRDLDEDGDDFDDAIERNRQLKDSRADPSSDSPSNMLVGERTRASPPGSPVRGNGASDLLASQSMQNRSLDSTSAQAPGSTAGVGGTFKRQRTSEVDIHDEEAPPSKKAKTNTAAPTMPSFPADGHLNSIGSSILSSGISTGMIAGPALANINARTEMSAAAGIPNMAGLVSNSAARPRGGLNYQFNRAITGGCGANPHDSSATAGTEAARKEAEVTIDSQVATSNIGGRADAQLDGTNTSNPVSGDVASEAASQEQAGMKSGLANGSSSQQMAPTSAQNTQDLTAQTQTSTLTAPQIDPSSKINQGSRVISQATTRIQPTATSAEVTPKPLPVMRQNDQGTTTAVPSRLSTLPAHAPDVIQSSTTPKSSHNYQGITSQGLREIARAGNKAIADPNSRLREAIHAQQTRSQDGNQGPTSERNPLANSTHPPSRSQPSRPEAHGATQISRHPTQSPAFTRLSQPDSHQQREARQISDPGRNRLSQPNHQRTSPQHSSRTGSTNGDLRSAASMEATRPRNSDVALSARASFGHQSAHPASRSPTIDIMQLTGRSLANNPHHIAVNRTNSGNAAPRSSSAHRDRSMHSPPPGPSQQNRPRGPVESTNIPHAPSAHAYRRTVTPPPAYRASQRGEDVVPPGFQANPLIYTSSQPTRQANRDRDYAVQPISRNLPPSQPARSSGNLAPQGEKKANSSSEEVKREKAPVLGRDSASQM